MSQIHILSRMTNTVMYRVYKYIGNVNEQKNQSLLPIPVRHVAVRGGADRPSNKSGFGDLTQDINANPLWTPRGVVTPVTDEEYEFLKEHWLFQKHLKGGYVEVVKSDVADNHKAISKIAASMADDPSAVMTKATQKVRMKVAVNMDDIKQ